MQHPEPDDPSPSEIFQIDVSDLLKQFKGAHEEYEFHDPIDTNVFYNFILKSDFHLQFQLTRNERGIEFRIGQLECTIDVPDDEIYNKSVCLYDITREFHLKIQDLDTDDIEYVDSHTETINIQNALEQEILISALI